MIAVTLSNSRLVRKLGAGAWNPISRFAATQGTTCSGKVTMTIEVDLAAMTAQAMRLMTEAASSQVQPGSVV